MRIANGKILFVNLINQLEVWWTKHEHIWYCTKYELLSSQINAQLSTNIHTLYENLIEFSRVFKCTSNLISIPIVYELSNWNTVNLTKSIKRISLILQNSRLIEFPNHQTNLNWVNYWHMPLFWVQCKIFNTWQPIRFVCLFMRKAFTHQFAYTANHLTNCRAPL